MIKKKGHNVSHITFTNRRINFWSSPRNTQHFRDVFAGTGVHNTLETLMKTLSDINVYFEFNGEENYSIVVFKAFC